MMIRFRHDDDRHRVIDAVFFKGEHDFSRGEKPGVRYSIKRTCLDDLDDSDREAVAVLVLKRWYKNVVATNESLRTFSRDTGKKAYQEAVESTANNVVDYAKDLLMENGRIGNPDREDIDTRLNEEVDTGLIRLNKFDVLRFTKNENAINDHGMPLSKQDPVQDIAYWAFYQDVLDAVNEEIDLSKSDLGLDDMAQDGED